MNYIYKITSIDEKERWIFLQADEWDLEEPDSFVYLLKKICSYVSGEVVDIGDDRYRVKNDPCNLVYQWDSLFGIAIIYPRSVAKNRVIEFLEFVLNKEEPSGEK